MLGSETRGYIVVLMGLAITACSGSIATQEYSTVIRCPDCPTLPVSRIIDGDTFDSPRGIVRLFGVDTPERGEKCFGSATDALRQLAGRRVRVELGPRALDSGGRSLFYVFTDAGNSIDEILVQQGLARVWTMDGQHRNHLLGVEEESIRTGSGCLW